MTRTLILLSFFVAACGVEGPAGTAAPGAHAPVVREDATGLAFTFADASGFHTVERIADVPPEARAIVRVEPTAGDEPRALPSDQVWVADLRAAGSDGTFSVRAESRDTFESRASPPAAPAPPPPPIAQAPGSAPPQGAQDPSASPHAGTQPNAAAGIVLYGTSWCGVCRTAREFFRARGVAFVERDIEREPGAREEMLQKARAQGIEPRGVPVIDVYGQIIPGFDQARISRLLSSI